MIDADESPVAAARVVLVTEPRLEMETGADGMFKFNGLLPASYVLLAHTADLAAGPLVVALDGSSGPVTLRMVATIPALLHVVDDATGVPIAKARAQVQDEGAHWIAGDEEGRISLAGLTRSRHRVLVESDDHAAQWIEVSPPAVANGASIDVRLRTGAVVSGTVTSGDGRPAAGVRVSVDRASRALRDPNQAPQSVLTDALGQFSFAAVASGEARILAEDDALGAGRSSALVLDGRTPFRDLQIRLSVGRSISGSVSLAEGAPAAFAVVRIADAASGAAFGAARSVRADSVGHFVVRGLAARTFRAFALQGSASSPVVALDLSRGDQSALQLHIDGGGTLEGVVVSSAGESLSDVQVVAVPSQQAVSGSARGVDPSVSGVATALTDAGGHFIIAGVSSGTYRVRAVPGLSSDSPSLWTRSGQLAEAGSRDLRIVVEGGGIVRGRVVYDDGQIPEQFTIQAGFGSVVPFLSSTDGSFALDNVPAGAQTLTVSGPDVAPYFVERVVVSAGVPTDVGTVRVQKLRTLSGRVTLTDGTPVSGASVTIAAGLVGDGSHFLGDDDGSLLSRTVVTTGDGHFSLPNASRVPLIAVAEKQSEGRSKTVALPAGDSTADIELTLQQTAPLRGTISHGDEPLAGAYVVVTTRDASRCRFGTTSDESGKYEFGTLSAGDYVVTASYRNDGAHFVQRSSVVTVGSASAATADISIPADDAQLRVEMRGGKAPLVAQLWLLTGDVRSSSAGALETDIASRGSGTAWFTQVTEQTSADFLTVVPGAYSLCATAVFADPSDVSAKTVAMRQAAQQPTRCVPVTVTSGASAVAITVP